MAPSRSKVVVGRFSSSSACAQSRRSAGAVGAAAAHHALVFELQGDCMTWDGHVVGAEPRGSVYECFAGRSKALLRPLSFIRVCGRRGRIAVIAGPCNWFVDVLVF